MRPETLQVGSPALCETAILSIVILPSGSFWIGSTVKEIFEGEGVVLEGEWEVVLAGEPQPANISSKERDDMAINDSRLLIR
jgi:hypothetical protein